MAYPGAIRQQWPEQVAVRHRPWWPDDYGIVPASGSGRITAQIYRHDPALRTMLGNTLGDRWPDVIPLGVLGEGFHMGVDRAGRRAVVGWIFYGGLALLLGLILLDLLADVLPARLARRIGYNSEGYLFALVVAAWIQFVRPRLAERSRWPLSGVAALGCLVIGLLLLDSELPSRFKTLNEPMIALALVLPYLTLRRAVPKALLLIPPLILLGVIVGLMLDPDGLVINLAESFGYWFLVPIVFDLVDKGILDPAAETSPSTRYLTYAVLTAVPVTVSALGMAEREGGGVHAWLSYLGRIHESFIGVLLPALYFAVVLGRTGLRRRRPTREAVPAR